MKKVNCVVARVRTEVFDVFLCDTAFITFFCCSPFPPFFSRSLLRVWFVGGRLRLASEGLCCVCACVRGGVERVFVFVLADCHG